MTIATPPPALPKPTLAERIARARDSDLWLSFKSSPVAIVSAAVTIVIILCALLADVLAPQDAFDPSRSTCSTASPIRWSGARARTSSS